MRTLFISFLYFLLLIECRTLPYHRDGPHGNNSLTEILIILHSHTDAGWIETYEWFYHYYVLQILSGLVRYLPLHPEARFMWADISFINYWFKHDASQTEKESFMNLTRSGQLEITHGGWV